MRLGAVKIRAMSLKLSTFELHLIKILKQLLLEVNICMCIELKMETEIFLFNFRLKMKPGFLSKKNDRVHLAAQSLLPN